MARNDMKGLTEEIANASQASMHLNRWWNKWLQWKCLDLKL
jgi:hypothetical protein